MNDTIVKTYKFRLVPNKEQASRMAQHTGASRFVWNKGLDYLEKRRKAGEKHVRFRTKEIGFAAQFIKWRNNEEELVWLKDLSSASIRYSLQRLDTAYQAAFQRLKKGQEAGFPKFRAKSTDESYTIPQGTSFKIGNKGIRLEKIGWVRMRPNSTSSDCSVEGKAKMVVIKRENTQWYACVQCEISHFQRPRHSGTAIGLDMGVSKPVTTSAGGIYTLPIKDKQVQRLEARRRRYQRIMARKRTAALRSVGWDGKSTTRAAAEKKLAQRQRDNQVQGEAAAAAI